MAIKEMTPPPLSSNKLLGHFDGIFMQDIYFYLVPRNKK